ncbi:hypothetical protein ACFXPT_38265 [Streptomyces goshikiensis]|uniref:hypothetical protein n=1 Tax=Streptomyces goshikiensis TaxID=1942 RepID=UPI00367A5A3E
MVLVMQTDAPFWDSLVFEGIDDVDVEPVTAAFGTVDVLPTREAGPLAAWLIRHPGVEIICRDRAGAYAEAPGAVRPVLRRSPTGFICGRALAGPWRPALPPTATASDNPSANERLPEATGEASSRPQNDSAPVGRRAERKKAAHASVHELLAQGHSHRAIARHLGWGPNTALRYANAACRQDTFREHRHRPSRLAPYKPYLERQFAEGCTNVTRLHGELVAEQAPVTYGVVRAHIATLREAPAGAPPRPPTVRRACPRLRRDARQPSGCHAPCLERLGRTPADYPASPASRSTCSGTSTP